MHNSIKNKHKSRSFEKITHIPLFTSLSPQVSSSSSASILSHSKIHTIQNNEIDSTNNYLLKKVQSINDSNLICCDCGSNKTVDWISINLLCILCIKCSGVHRSLGTHISKIRSLTLDTFKDSELRFLIKTNLRNDLINQIYESKLSQTDKIHSNATDSQRVIFIRDKYVNKKYVDSKGLDYNASLKGLIKAIHNEKIIEIQQIIARSQISLRKLSQQYNEENGKDQKYVSLFKYSLKHNLHKDDGTIIFNITEFLLINDLIIDNNIPIQSTIQDKWPKQALQFWKSKLEIYGDVFLSIDKNKQSSSPQQQQQQQQEKNDDEDTSLPVIRSLSIDQKKRTNSIKRWSLANIPKTSQNIISMHKSLKRSNKKNNSATTSATTPV